MKNLTYILLRKQLAPIIKRLHSIFDQEFDKFWASFKPLLVDAYKEKFDESKTKKDIYDFLKLQLLRPKEHWLIGTAGLLASWMVEAAEKKGESITNDEIFDRLRKKMENGTFSFLLTNTATDIFTIPNSILHIAKGEMKIAQEYINDATNAAIKAKDWALDLRKDNAVKDEQIQRLLLSKHSNKTNDRKKLRKPIDVDFLRKVMKSTSLKNDGIPNWSEIGRKIKRDPETAKDRAEYYGLI